MTGDPGPPQQELPLELLADLHAGVLDERAAAELRPRVDADPRARAVLAALDLTVSDLARVAAAPAPRMPADVAARLEDAIAGEAARRGSAPAAPVTAGPVTTAPQHPAPPPGAPVIDLAAARRRRRRGAIGGAGLLAAAAAAVGFFTIGGLDEETAGSPQAGDQPAAPAPDETPDFAEDELGGALQGALGNEDYGPLDEPDALAGCLTANGIPDGTDPLGAQEITLDGEPGVLMILPGGEAGRFRLLVVGPDCGPDNPSVMADDVVGR